MSKLLPWELEKWGICKFIHLNDGTYGFFDTKCDHEAMVPKGLNPVSAGFIWFDDGYFTVTEQISLTLKLGPLQEDESNISRATGMSIIRGGENAG